MRKKREDHLLRRLARGPAVHCDAEGEPGTEAAELPGGLEWQREQDYARNGIPISHRHQNALQELADELGVTTPFVKYANTRFDGK